MQDIQCKTTFKQLRFSWSEAWNPPTWGCKSMVEGPTIMLGVFITLLYIHTIPNIYYCGTCMLLHSQLMAKLAWKSAGNQDFFLIWGMKPARTTWVCKSMVGPYNEDKFNEDNKW